MKHKKNGKRYNDDFRQMIVDLYHSGQSVKNLSRKYGGSEVSIYNYWIQKLNPVELETVRPSPLKTKKKKDA